jgi:hypothetical protein
MQSDSKRFLLVGLGLAMVAGFFLPWTRGVHISGWQMATAKYGGHHLLPFLTRFAFFMVPVLGAVLAGAGFAGVKGVKHAAIGSGVLVFGYTIYKVIDAFVSSMGYGLWMIFGAAAVALFVGLTMAGSSEKRAS